MDRRKLFAAFIGVFALPAGYLTAKDHGNGKGKGNKNKEKEENGGEHAGPDSHYFRRDDYAAVQRYYTGPSNLPPGLRKKYYRTGRLPPGWQKKLRPFPPELIRQLPPPPPNYERGYIDGVAVVYDRKTRVILDVIDIVGALSGR
jgi:hypothetical protein